MFPIQYRPNYFKAYLSEFILERLHKHSPNRRVEIELRKGRFLGTGKTTKLPEYVKNLSFQTPVLFGSSVKAPQGFLTYAFSSLDQFPYRFDSSIEEAQFYELVNIMADYFPPSARETEFTVDFNLGLDSESRMTNGGYTNGRFTWDLATNTIAENSKLDKENIDILHQTHEYRLSICFETGEKVPFSEFLQRLDLPKLGNLRNIRVKFRRNFTFQFFKFFFTCVWTLDSKADQSKIVNLARMSQEAEELGGVLGDRITTLLNNSKATKTFEIESEIIDVNMLGNYLHPNERMNFNMLLDRFFRNFELLYHAPATLELREYRKHFEEKGGAEGVVKPVIGCYLDTLIKKTKNEK
jgi:hypothetical protein